MRIVCLVGGMILLFSCKVWKQKTALEQATVEHTALSLTNQEKQITTVQMQSLDKELEDTQLELIAKDVFYWHPDSGILSRSGPIAVKIQSRLMKEQLVGKLQLREQSKLQDTLLTNSKQVKNDVLIKEVSKEKKIRWDIWIFLGIIGTVLVFLGLRFFFRSLWL